jgi:two-component system sensor histidine kinase CpxA
VIFLWWLLSRDIASPIHELATVVNEFGRGQFAVRARADRRDEVGHLGRSFNQMAERIETLVTAERRLLRDVSHELRSPLTRLNLAIELSRRASDPNAEADRLQREADRLTLLVGTLLDVVRLEAEPDPVSPVLCNVGDVVRKVVNDCDIEARGKGCHIEIDDNTPTPALGNQELLRRAIENVVRNAIRHAPEGTMIVITCQRRDKDVVVSVRDFGPGVSTEALSQLGNPFFRVDPSRDGATGGLGLGLAIARRAIQLHHGTWSVQNSDPGLTVVMTVPMAA